MTILVTGARGLLGSALVRTGATLGLSRAELDITDAQAISRALELHRPRALINAAAQAKVDLAESQVARTEAVNAVAGRDVSHQIEKVYVKVHGHGMPIPAPGYLFRDGNRQSPYPGLAYAGVDNGRLPLLLEAMDSGISAARLVGVDGD